MSDAPRYFRLWLGIALLGQLPVSLNAADQTGWRFWTAADGMQESYSFSLTVGPNGKVCVRHGAVPFLSVLDGYGVTRIPDIRKTASVDRTSSGRGYFAADGTIWLVSQGILKQYRDGAWKEHYRWPDARDLLSAAPLGKRVYVLFTGVLREYDPQSGAWRDIQRAKETAAGPFLDMTAGSGSIWITGEKGIARFELEGDNGAYHWQDISGGRLGL